MSIAPRALLLDEVAFEAVEQPGENSWLAVEVDRDHSEPTAQELAAAIEQIARERPSVRHVVGAWALLHALRSAPEGIVVLHGVENFSAEDWGIIDRQRSMLYRRRPVILLLTREAAESLMQRAPNLASWIGGRLWRVGEETLLGSEACEARLAALRTWSGLSDEEVIERAFRGALPRDPEYGEWLVLLGRGDLLER